MKIIRFGESGKEKTGILINEQRYDVSDYFYDYEEDFFTNNGIQQLNKLVITSISGLEQVSDGIRFGPPINRPLKIISIGLNFTDHAKESSMPEPVEPAIFFKSATAVAGPDDNLVVPKSSHKTYREMELAVVIGKKASYVMEPGNWPHCSHCSP